MTVEAIKNANRSCLDSMAAGAVIGAGAGLGLKYAYRLNNQEKNTKEYLSVVQDINNKKGVYSAWTESMLDKINNKKIKSLAEDVFVKTYDGLKEGDKVGNSRIIKAYKTIMEQKPDELREIVGLFHGARAQAEKVAKKHLEIYNIATKHIRPTGFFVGVGAAVGAAVALAKEVLHTDVNENI